MQKAPSCPNRKLELIGSGPLFFGEEEAKTALFLLVSGLEPETAPFLHHGPAEFGSSYKTASTHFWPGLAKRHCVSFTSRAVFSRIREKHRKQSKCGRLGTFGVPVDPETDAAPPRVQRETAMHPWRVGRTPADPKGAQILDKLVKMDGIGVLGHPSRPDLGIRPHGQNRVLEDPSGAGLGRPAQNPMSSSLRFGQSAKTGPKGVRNRCPIRAPPRWPRLRAQPYHGRAVHRRCHLGPDLVRSGQVCWNRSKTTDSRKINTYF